MFLVLLLQLTKTAAFSRQRPYSNYNQNSARHNCNLKPLQASSAIADVSDGWLSPQQIKTLRKEIDDRRRRKRLAYKRLHDGALAGDFDHATVDAADLTKVEPFDGKKVVAAEEGHPLDAKS